MAHLRSRKTPAAAPGGHEWPDGDTILEIEDGLANELLHISGAEFYEVLPSDPEHPEHEAWAEAEKARADADADDTDADDTEGDTDTDSGDDTEAKTSARRRTRRTPIAE